MEFLRKSAGGATIANIGLFFGQPDINQTTRSNFAELTIDLKRVCLTKTSNILHINFSLVDVFHRVLKFSTFEKNFCLRRKVITPTLQNLQNSPNMFLSS